jgi:hypothetical protein
MNSFIILTFLCNPLFRSILNQPSEYKVNNVPIKLFPWEEPHKPAHDDKSFRIVQKGKNLDKSPVQLKSQC